MKIRFLTAGDRYCFICLLSIAIVCASVSRGYAQSYYPDEFGNTWILHSTDGARERVVKIEEVPETIGTELLKVISDQTDGNISKLFIKGEPDRILIFRAIAPVAPFGEISIDYSPPETFLPIPTVLGKPWTVTGEAKLLGIQAKVVNIAKVVAIEPVAVPAGTFQGCLKIEQQLQILLPINITFPPRSSTMWLAPGIGLVKATNSDGIDFELIDYEITIDGIVVAVQPKGELATIWGALKKRSTQR